MTAMRIVVARCSVNYAGRLDAHAGALLCAALGDTGGEIRRHCHR